MSIRLQDLNHDCINHIGKFLNQDDVDVLIGIGLKAKCRQIVDALRIDYKHRQSTEWNQSLNKYNEVRYLMKKYNENSNIFSNTEYLQLSVNLSFNSIYTQLRDILYWAISTCDMRIIYELNTIRKDLILYKKINPIQKTGIAREICDESQISCSIEFNRYNQSIINALIENIQSAIKNKCWLMVLLYIYYTYNWADINICNNKLYYYLMTWEDKRYIHPTSYIFCVIEIEFDNFIINQTFDLYDFHIIENLSKYISNINIKLSKKMNYN